MALRHYRLRHTVVVINSITAVRLGHGEITDCDSAGLTACLPCLQSKLILKFQHNTVISAYRRRYIIQHFPSYRYGIFREHRRPRGGLTARRETRRRPQRTRSRSRAVRCLGWETSRPHLPNDHQLIRVYKS